MQPEILEIPEKRLAGIYCKMSLPENKTARLWKRFKLLTKDIINASDYFSLQVYPEGYFLNFNAAIEFEKWALTEVSAFDHLPDALTRFTIPKGLYAVFHYKGSAADANDFFKYIFTEWLPNSNYQLDHRPHFEILGEKYKNNDPASEEMVYIPIKIKA